MTDFDLRGRDGTLLRLKRLPGESDDDYASRRAETKNGKTRLQDSDDYEPIEDDDWTPEDDRLVMIGRIAEQIETMPVGDLERVLSAAKAGARPGGKDRDLADTMPSAMHEILAHLGGRSVVEISEAMGDGRWWDQLSGWVDEQRS